MSTVRTRRPTLWALGMLIAAVSIAGCDPSTGTLLPDVHTGPVHSVAFNLDGKLLASAGASKDVQLWEVVSGKELAPFKGHTRWVRFCAFSPDGRMLASAGLDNVVRVWEVATRKQVAELTGHQRRIHFVTFSHSGRQLGTAGMDWTVKLWDTPKLAHSPASPTDHGGGEGGGSGSGSGVRDACRAESERLCAGDERVGRCLRAQTDQLSAGCRAALESRRGNQ